MAMLSAKEKTKHCNILRGIDQYIFRISGGVANVMSKPATLIKDCKNNGGNKFY
jgi:hypothetical protein